MLKFLVLNQSALPLMGFCAGLILALLALVLHSSYVLTKRQLSRLTFALPRFGGTRCKLVKSDKPGHYRVIWQQDRSSAWQHYSDVNRQGYFVSDFALHDAQRHLERLKRDFRVDPKIARTSRKLHIRTFW